MQILAVWKLFSSHWFKYVKLTDNKEEIGKCAELDDFANSKFANYQQFSLIFHNINWISAFNNDGCYSIGDPLWDSKERYC